MVTQGARGGTERNGTGPTRAAEATGPTRAATATGKDNRYACCYFLSLFLYFHLFFILLFFFSDYFSFDNCNNRQGTKEKSRTDGTGYTWAVIATWDGTEGADGANGYVIFYVFVLSDLLFYSYHSSSFPIISFSVEYNNRRAGRDRWQRRTGRGSRQARQVRLLLQFFFLLFSFLLLTSIISFVANYSNRRGEAKWDGTGRDDAATAMRDGGQAGGRRR